MILAKKKEPNSARFQKTPFKNDCGQKIPIQAVQDTTWRLVKKDCGQKNRTKQCKLQNGSF